jgi:putative ATP-dependent endonuclease of OLD family
MYISRIIIENFRCFGEGDQGFELHLKQGLTALVGENDAGKTAVIDAIRYALGTRDQEWNRIEDSDFYDSNTSNQIKIVCRFDELNPDQTRAFAEYLTYDTTSGKPIMYVNWTAKDTGEVFKGRSFRRVEVHSGENGDGPTFAPEVRELLCATYLRPLRDAEQAMTSGRASRLSQILHHTPHVKSGGSNYSPTAPVNPKNLNVLGIGDFANALLEKQQGIVDTRENIDQHLDGLALHGERLKSSIKVSGATAPDNTRLRHLLEKLDLVLEGPGKLGLGSNNLLFIACELLLLAQEEDINKLLLIEEPEAHLHSQRQLRVMKFMEEQARRGEVQVIVTTHSPNLASAVNLNSLVLIRDNQAFPLAKGYTKLSTSDYSFLNRFLDVTKANLFFARGVMIVEGDAENILIPVLARLLGFDFTERGISMVNVGGLGLRRYARIFQRQDVSVGSLTIPVACVTDMDIMPDCAPVIIGKIDSGDEWPQLNKRKWRAKKDIGDQSMLAQHKRKIEDKASGQFVKTFIADEWTLEYSLALGPDDGAGGYRNGLAELVFIAACLAENDEDIHERKKSSKEVFDNAKTDFLSLKSSIKPIDGCASEELLASHIYSKFVRSKASKAIAAQYLASLLEMSYTKGTLSAQDLRQWIPSYLIEAIEYVTDSSNIVADDHEYAN